MILFHLIPYEYPIEYIRGRNLIINGKPMSISIYDLLSPTVPKHYVLNLEISSHVYKYVDVHRSIVNAGVITI